MAWETVYDARSSIPWVYILLHLVPLVFWGVAFFAGYLKSALFWLGSVAFILFVGVLLSGEYERINESFRDGRMLVIEGPVTRYEPPNDGEDLKRPRLAPEKFTVSGVEFSQHFRTYPCWCYNGAGDGNERLAVGDYVRISYMDNKIYRLEIAK